MQFHIFSRLLILFILLCGGFTSLYAADVLDDEINGLTALPVIETYTEVALGDGSTGTITVITDPTTGNSAGTAKRDDNSFFKWIKTGASGGGYNYSITENGVTSNAIVDSSGNATGNAADKAGALGGVTNGISSNPSKPEIITTITSEKVPGADCVCYEAGLCDKVETRKYKCTTKAGLTGFQDVFAKIIRYVINIMLLLGVLAVVGLGIAWSFAGGDDVKAKTTLKTWAINIIVGLLILFMFSYILRFLAPWVYR